MSNGRNPFSHLIPSNSGIVDLDDSGDLEETEKWRKRGAIGGRSLKGLIPPMVQKNSNTPIENPKSGSNPNPFSHLIPNSNKNNPQNEMIDTFLGKMPSGPARAPFGSKESFANPEMIQGLINSNVGGPGIKMVGKGIGSFGKNILNVLKQKSPKELAYGVQKAHDVLKSQASDIYDLVKSEVKPRGVNNINVSKDILEEAKRHLPKDTASNLLIKNAESGDYEALHKLQSDLGKEGTRNLGAESYADRNIGKEMLDTREKINESITNQFKEYGHEDLVKLLDMAKNKWAKLKDIYYSHPAISKLVHEESRKIPKNPLNVFSEESKPMGKLIAEHPEIAEALEKSKSASRFMHGLKTGAKVAGVVGASGIPVYGAYKLIDLLKGND